MPSDIYEDFIASVEDYRRVSYFSDVDREMRNSRVAARQFIEAGAVIGVGTDGGAPLNMHTEAMWREMSALAESGMRPMEVIVAATRMNAKILGIDAEAGTIAPGKVADILIVDGI
jgi:imidazolonepropionase-like amidohydrolase